MGKPTAVVIGAGLGGIATAARLAQNGYQVTVLEKCERAGGRCARMVIEGHHFDTGPTLFLMPSLYAQAFADLGLQMEDHLDLRRVDPSYRIHFDDGLSLSMTSDMAALHDQLESVERGSFRKYLSFLKQAEAHYRLAIPNIVGRNFFHFWDFFNLRNLLLLFKINVLNKHIDHASKYFQDRRLQVALTFQDMYLGISPYDAPATYSLLQFSETAEGVWYPKGGMYRVIEVMIGIAEKAGVEFIYDASVKKIDIKGKRATGVTLEEGRHYPADTVVANSDLTYVYSSLLPDDGMAEKLERKNYSFSAISFFWGLDKQYPQFEAHNLFMYADDRRSFDQIFDELTLPDKPCFYVHAPTRLDPSLAPKGRDSLIVIVPTGHINEADPQDWEALRDRAREIVLARFEEIGVHDLKEHIKFEVDFTPPDWKKRYNLTKGSQHGLSYILTQVGYMRPHNRHERYRNLYFVGASTHPGAGLPMVLLSSRLTTERILHDAKKSRTQNRSLQLEA